MSICQKQMEKGGVGPVKTLVERFFAKPNYLRFFRFWTNMIFGLKMLSDIYINNKKKEIEWNYSFPSISLTFHLHIFAYI